MDFIGLRSENYIYYNNNYNNKELFSFLIFFVVADGRWQSQCYFLVDVDAF